MTVSAHLPLLTEDPKRGRILQAAADMFLSYGFGRTTMDDIARAAEMSRPALYQHFKNKTDIYREIAAGFVSHLIEDAHTIMLDERPLSERLDELFENTFICLREDLEKSPHGAEILDMKDQISGELIEKCRGRISECVARAIDHESERNGVDLAARGLTPRGLADIVLDSFDGAKERRMPLPRLREQCRLLSRLVSFATSA